MWHLLAYGGLDVLRGAGQQRGVEQARRDRHHAQLNVPITLISMMRVESGSGNGPRDQCDAVGDVHVSSSRTKPSVLTVHYGSHHGGRVPYESADHPYELRFGAAIYPRTRCDQR